MLSRTRFVLVETSHPGNIGAVARAMKNMGMNRLYLVRPSRFPHAEATARASGADDVLAAAVSCQSLDEALRGCGLVFGTSARLRSLPWPVRSPRECAAQVASAGENDVAVVFGREHSGLTNAELDRCNYLVNIPCNPKYSSLNIAAAAQVIAYELFLASDAIRNTEVSGVDGRLASAEELDGLYAHMEQALVEIGFLDPANPRLLMRRLRRMFNRIQLEQAETNILRGILTAAQRSHRQRKR